MMWKHYCLLFLIISTVIEGNSNRIINKIISAIDKNLMYLTKNYEKINSDCLYGIVLSGAILENIENCAGPYSRILHKFQTNIDEIYTKTVQILQQQPYWNNFAKYIVDRRLVRKTIKFRYGNFKKRPQLDKKLNMTEELSDYCLSTLINQTINLEVKWCKIPEVCHAFNGDFAAGSGYIKTHQLLFLQLAHQRHCLMNSDNLQRIVHKICETIYNETYNLDKLQFFDLFLEQSILCGLEGFVEFVENKKWLELILTNQKFTGCFPGSIRNNKQRQKRTINEFSDGCTDHTTGLGTAVLSLYLNYHISNKYRCDN